ncbi:MAG: restriction endonuclease [Candidatus Hydrogenedentes bacterium]|nr:restriction endonuclease [Candidatus Hydrogenedentota bacterium]
MSTSELSEKMKIPTFDSLMAPLLQALLDLGGSGSVDEIYERVIENEKIPEVVLEKLHDPEKSNQTEVGYRLAWARTYLKKYGLLENSARGVWTLTPKANTLGKVEPREVVRFVQGLDKKLKEKRLETTIEPANHGATTNSEEWREKLHHILTKELSPSAFERLTQRVLRESGFIQVEVTGRSGDGGIDGKGIARIHGFMSFHVIFQCKKYQNSIGASEIRDFRGTMVGRADKGLFITTSTFTPAAIKEATRDGAPPIDLVDGEQLAEKLKELGLGVKTELVETAIVETDWFANL